MIDNELRFVCWEAKFLKKPMAFNFNRIEEQQSYYLAQYAHAKSIVSYVIVGVDYGRSDKRVFVFNWDDNMAALYKKGFSIHLKHLNKLPYNRVSKGAFSFENIVYYKDLQELV